MFLVLNIVYDIVGPKMMCKMKNYIDRDYRGIENCSGL